MSPHHNQSCRGLVGCCCMELLKNKIEENVDITIEDIVSIGIHTQRILKLGCVIIKAVLLDILRYASFGVKANLAVYQKGVWNDESCVTKHVISDHIVFF